MHMNSLKILMGAILLLSSSITLALKPWPEFIKELRVEALKQGIRPEIFDMAFAGIKEPNRRILYLDKTQPEKRLFFLKYRDTRADKFRIYLGRKEYKRHEQILNQVGKEFGVSPCFIVSLWGLETSYGRYMGTFPVIKSLATLAYDNRRSAFFRKELFIALHILNGGHVSLADFKGEWAGASGHPQFLPSSWNQYAVDYNRDGRKDIWRSLDDVFASIANYLKQNGWQADQPWAIEVNTPENFDEALMDRNITKTVSEWQKMGVQPVGGELPSGDLPASIIKPYGGPTFMIFNNFKVLMRWNRSIYYAGTVGYMAEEVCKKKL